MTSRAPIATRPAADELRRLYVDERQSCAAIAKPLGCDPTTVRHWLVAAGIQTRPRGDISNMQGRRRASDWRPSAEARAKIGVASKARWDDGRMAGRKHWLKDAPPEMNPRWLGGVTPERQAFYRSPEWKAVCVVVWRRADGCCQRCAADSRDVPRSEGAFHVHHIVSFKVRELRADPSNLALLCRDCHLWVHSRANAAGEWIAADEPDLVRYLRAAEMETKQPTLFDVLDAEAA